MTRCARCGQFIGKDGHKCRVSLRARVAVQGSMEDPFKTPPGKGPPDPQTFPVGVTSFALDIPPMPKK